MVHKTVLLFDVLERTIDNRGKTPPISEAGFALVEVKHIQSGRLYPVFDDTKYVDQTTWDSWFRGHLEPGDLLFSTVGSIGRSCIVPDAPKFCIAQNVLGFRVNRSKADPRYVYYAINGDFFRHEVHGRTIETVQKSIKVHDLKTARIQLPLMDRRENQPRRLPQPKTRTRRPLPRLLRRLRTRRHSEGVESEDDFGAGGNQLRQELARQ